MEVSEVVSVVVFPEERLSLRSFASLISAIVFFFLRCIGMDLDLVTFEICRSLEDILFSFAATGEQAVITILIPKLNEYVCSGMNMGHLPQLIKVYPRRSLFNWAIFWLELQM